MKQAILAACAVLLLTAGALAQNTTPRQVIKELRQAYSKVQSLRATIQIKMGETYISSVQFVRPRQFSVQVTQNGKLLYSFVSDGSTYTHYDANEKKYVQQPVEQGQPLLGAYLTFVGYTSTALEPHFGELLEDLAQQNFNKVRQKGTQKVGNTPCRVVDLSGKGGTMTLFLGQKDGLLYRMVFRSRNGDIFEEKVTALQVNTPIPKTVFAFKPPAGAQKVEEPQVARREDTTTLEGQAAPDFTLTDLEGNEVSLSSLRGKVVFLDFWATWCPPCRESLPHTQALSQHERAKSGDLVVLAVNAREELDKVKKFMQDNGYSFRVLMDKDGAVLNAYRVQGIPTFVLIDREGKISQVWVGFAPGSEKQMEEAVQQALGQ
ncbi:MAG: redoxin family protein [Armatimonadota bacterium]|nr:redoxin family protein [Armatimonadota bacterium]